MANKIQIKRGLKAQLPTLNTGEFGLCTDTEELFIGNSSNLQIITLNDADYIKVKSSSVDMINSAILLAKNMNLQGVFIPKKTTPYIIEKEIIVHSDIHLYSNGAEIQPTGSMITSKATMIRNVGFDANGYNGDKNIIIEGFVLNSLNQSVGGISLCHTSDCIIRRNKIINVAQPSHAMDLAGNKNLLVTYNVCSDGNQSAIQIDECATGSVPALTLPKLNEDGTSCFNIRIENNSLYRINASAIHIHKRKHKNIFISKNYFENCMLGVADDGTYGTNHENLNITNNTFVGGENSTSIALYSGCRNGIITGNICDTKNNGILLMKNDNNNQYYNMVISHNTITNAIKTPILITDGRKVIIEGNIIGDYGSDTVERNGIYIIDSNYVKIIGNEIFNSISNLNRVGIRLSGSDNIDILTNSIISVATGVMGNSMSKYVKVNSNTFRNIRTNCIFFEGAEGAVMELLKINNNIIDDCGNFGVRIMFANYCDISMNTFLNFRTTGTCISCSKVGLSTINGNLIDTQSSIGIGVSGESSTVRYGKNTICNNIVKGVTNGIQVLNFSNNNIVCNNVVEGSTLTAISTSDNVVANNRII